PRSLQQPMYSVVDDLTAGFPHSEICGSQCVCSLPAAYRKLQRPSSPDIAKASTMCTYSLVSITLTSVLPETVIKFEYCVPYSRTCSHRFHDSRTLSYL